MNLVGLRSIELSYCLTCNCPNRTCSWANIGLCYHCAYYLLGDNKGLLKQWYRETHMNEEMQYPEVRRRKTD